MPEFVKFFGIPGSGKTTRLILELENSGQPLVSMCFVTFSKSTGMEIKNRISKKFDIDREELPFYGTIHSICNRLLQWDLKNNDPKLVTDHEKADYLSRYGLSYPIKYSGSDIPEVAITDAEIAEISDAEKIFAIINWCNHRLVPLDKWRHINVTFNEIDPDVVKGICEGWENYKNENGLVDFDDMLLQTIAQQLVPYADTLFVDEFQDLTPLLYKVYSLWSKDMDKVFVAGDDDQTIYTWSGASPHFLLDLDAEEIILNKSYRVPSNILKKAEALISTVADRKYKSFLYANEGGQFIHLSTPTFEEIMSYFPQDVNKEVYFLFRTNFLADYFCRYYLIPKGIPFSKLRPHLRVPNIWTKKLVGIRDVVSKIQWDEILWSDDVKRLLFLPSCKPSMPRELDSGYIRYGKKAWFKKKKETREWTNQDLLKEMFVKLPKWGDTAIIRELSSDLQKQAYRRNIELGHHHLSPYKIKVGTLHSAKGLETDTVFIFNNHTTATEKHLSENGQMAIDAEKRLYYVGITRAMESCILIDNFFYRYVFDMEVEL